MTTTEALPLLEEARYYQGIEEAFVSLRGDPLFLSNADWSLARRWREAGTPLRIVLRGLQDAVDTHAHSWGRKRKIASLRYCEAEVERARERWVRALGTGCEDSTRLDASLREVAARLENAALPGPRSREVASRIGALILSMLGQASPAEMDRRLAAWEVELFGALDEEEGPEVALGAADEAHRGLAPYEGRMPRKILDQIREDAVLRLRLAAYELPRLSLFHIGEGAAYREGPSR